MEVITEKGHTFAEELQKVSYIILAYIVAFCPHDLGVAGFLLCPFPLCATVASSENCSVLILK